MYAGIGEKLYQLDNGNYLFVQDSSDGGYDYTYLDGKTRSGIDGGVIEDTLTSDGEVLAVILSGLGLDEVSYEPSELDYWEHFDA